jgi:hypothetical protein
MLDRLFGPKQKRTRGSDLNEIAYRARQRIVEVQIPFFEKREAELQKRIAEKQATGASKA